MGGDQRRVAGVSPVALECEQHRSAAPNSDLDATITTGERRYLPHERSTEGWRKVEFAHWIATVDEQPTAGNENSGESAERLGAGFRGPSIQRSHAYCERQIVGSFVGLQYEIFDGNLTHAEPPFGDELAGREDNLPDRFD
jgi:hypothetical protein